MEESFDPHYANEFINSIENMLNGIMVFSNTMEQSKAFTYEDYVGLQTLVKQVKESIEAYYNYLARVQINPRSSYLTALLYGSESRIDTIEHAEEVLIQMEEVLGINKEEEQARCE
jgi:hypothetical protein